MARMEAARKETSVSRLLGGILRERMLEKDCYEAPCAGPSRASPS